VKRFRLAPDIPQAHRAEFDGEVRQKTATASWVVNLLAFLMYPMSYVLDVTLVPEHAPALLRVRIAETVALGGLLVVQAILRRRGLAARLARPVAAVLIITIWSSLVGFSLITGGPGSNYFGGLTLLLTAVLIAFPWGLVEMGLVCLAVFGSFDLAMVVLGTAGEGYQFHDYFNANYFYIGTTYIGLFWVAAGNNLRIREFLGRKEVEAARARSEELLLNVLPGEVAEELKARGRVDARSIDSCSILFTDFVGFTRLADRSAATDLVQSLDKAFSRFDAIVDRWGLEKLKTIGDAYMCAGGVLASQPDHLLRTVLAGLEMQKALEDEGLAAADGSPWRMRVGIHAGPVVAGVIGQKKFAYDLWGDTVNTASRLEAAGHPRTINLATRTYRAIEPFFEGVDRGLVPVRGKVPMAMTGVTRLRERYSADPDGRIPNDLFREHARQWIERQANPVMGVPAETRGEPVVLDAAGPDPLLALAGLTAEDRDVLRELAQPLRFAPGTVLVEQGQLLGELLLVVKGLLGVRVSRDGVGIEVGHVHPGEVVGEMSFVSWEPASATVVALDEVTVMRFEAAWMEPLMNRHPQTGMRMLHSLALVLAQRVRESNARLLEAEGRRAAARPEDARPDADPSSLPATLREAVAAFRDRMAALDRQPLEGSDLESAVREACDGLLTGAAAAPEHAPAARAWIAREVEPWLLRSHTVERLRTRPRGPVLDYPVTESLFAGRPRGLGALGSALDAWFLSGPLAAPARECLRRAGTEVVAAWQAHPPAEGPLRAAVVAGGAAPGLFAALAAAGNPPNLEITCMDRDLGALSLAGRRAMETGRGSAFTFVCEDVLGGGTRHTRLRHQQLVCLPLMAEPPDGNRMILLLDEMHDSLVPGGRFVCGVLQPAPGTRWFAETLLDWHAGALGRERLRQLVSRSAFGRGPCEIDEGDGVLFLRLTRGAA
jgi:class 3 adenylate cyclase/CRP-like cAMP-binding protein